LRAIGGYTIDLARKKTDVFKRFCVDFRHFVLIFSGFVLTLWWFFMSIAAGFHVGYVGYVDYMLVLSLILYCPADMLVYQL
jgi:hypothetical protein